MKSAARHSLFHPFNEKRRTRGTVWGRKSAGEIASRPNSLLQAGIPYPVGHASVVGALLIEAPDVSLDVADELLLVRKIRFPYQGTITEHPHARSPAHVNRRTISLRRRRRWRSRRAPVRTSPDHSGDELASQCHIIYRWIHSEVMLHVTSSASVIATRI